MQKYITSVKALSFSDERGNFIVREEFESMAFSNMEWANRFMSERKGYWERMFDMRLIMSPRHDEVLKEEHIIPVFELVGEYMGLPEGQIFDKTRKTEIVHARWFAMKICSDRGVTEHQIADKIGLNHSTINNGKAGCSQLILKNEAKKAEFNMATDYALYAINGKYSEDGSGKLLKLPTI